MQALYRIHFEVRGEKPETDLSDPLANACWKWLFDPKRRFAPPATMPAGCVTLPRIAFAAGTHAEAILWREDHALKWALAFSHPDPRDSHIQWRTELGIERTTAGRVFFSCSLYVGRTNQSLAPFRRSTSRPRIVLDILKQFHGYGALPLTSTPLQLKSDPQYIKAFLALITDQRRQHPVVYVSTHQQSESFFFDVARLAEHLAGTAYVVVSESTESCHLLAREMPVHLRAFDGAVRLYWPGFTFRSDAFDHPLWTKHTIVNIQTHGRDAFSKKLLADIAAVCASTVPETMLTWAKIEEAARHHAIGQAKTAKDNAELLKLYEEENPNLRLRIAGLEQELQTKGEELYRAQARIVMLENAQHAETPEEFLPVECAADAIEQASSRWPNELVFAPNSKSEGDDSPFQPASEVLAALEWLAAVYHPAKLGKTKVTNLDKSIREKIPGWAYSARQSEAATGRFREWYECKWDGRTYSITEHIGTGSSTRPEETIRIAFAWDKPRSKIVIGFIGQHQKNTKS